jgi:hypothetical protein
MTHPCRGVLCGMPDESTTLDDRDDRDGIDIAGRLVTTVALLAVVGTIVALIMVQRIGTGYRDVLEVTRDGSDVAATSAESATALATDLASLTTAAADGLDQTARIVELASASLLDVGTAMSTNLADGIEGTAKIADDTAGFIEVVEGLIPGDNSDSLAEELRTLSDGLDPVPDQLRSLGDQLSQESTDLTGTLTTFDQLQTQLDELSTSISQASVTLAKVQTSADELAVRAQDALDRSGTDLWLIRVRVLIVGAGVAAACLAARRALHALRGAGGGTRTHTPLGTGS